MTRSLRILGLRIAAALLDLAGRPHNIRRRLGQLTRVRKEVVAATFTSNTEPTPLSVVASVANQQTHLAGD